MSLPAPVKSVLRYTRRVLQGLDHFANTLLGGEPDETISFRAAVDVHNQRRAVRWPACVLCRLLDMFQRDHCALQLAAGKKSANLLAALIDEVAPPNANSPAA